MTRFVQDLLAEDVVHIGLVGELHTVQEGPDQDVAIAVQDAVQDTVLLVVGLTVPNPRIRQFLYIDFQ